jgi:hypothetical protein
MPFLYLVSQCLKLKFSMSAVRRSLAWFSLGTALSLALLQSSRSYADELMPLSFHGKGRHPQHPNDLMTSGVLIAQSDGDDAYDPFADYSEFEESMDEEEDINFFRNGRLLTLGLNFGYRGWTQTLGQIYSGNPSFGLFMSYFFDLRFALQLGYLTGDHALFIPARNGADAIQGTISMTDLSVAMKYYFNTQNVTRGLADLNPYVLTGFSQLYRTAVVSGSTSFAKDSAFGFDLGAGIEIPMLRNKMFFGAQIMYQAASFSDEGNTITDRNDRSTGVSPRGDTWNALGVIGINF